MWNTKYNPFLIVIPGFSECESAIANDIPSISSNIISNRKSQTTYILAVRNEHRKWVSSKTNASVDKLAAHKRKRQLDMIEEGLFWEYVQVLLVPIFSQLYFTKMSTVQTAGLHDLSANRATPKDNRTVTLQGLYFEPYDRMFHRCI